MSVRKHPTRMAAFSPDNLPVKNPPKPMTVIAAEMAIRVLINTAKAPTIQSQFASCFVFRID